MLPVPRSRQGGPNAGFDASFLGPVLAKLSTVCVKRIATLLGRWAKRGRTDKGNFLTPGGDQTFLYPAIYALRLPLHIQPMYASHSHFASSLAPCAWPSPAPATLGQADSEARRCHSLRIGCALLCHTCRWSRAIAGPLFGARSAHSCGTRFATLGPLVCYYWC